jgi:hypothetical protein
MLKIPEDLMLDIVFQQSHLRTTIELLNILSGRPVLTTWSEDLKTAELAKVLNVLKY